MGAVPKKDAKGFAYAAWLKLLRSGQLPTLDVLQAALQRFTASESWQRDNGRYVPQMGNWLRGQRWLDPLSPAEEQERQRRQEANHALLAQQEEEKRRQERWNEQKARLKQFYDAFAARFAAPFNEAMAFGTWMHLHSKELAPLSHDVPADNALGSPRPILFQRYCLLSLTKHASPSVSADPRRKTWMKGRGPRPE